VAPRRETLVARGRLVTLKREEFLVALSVNADTRHGRRRTRTGPMDTGSRSGPATG
jgi:hypothetical protein